MITSKYLSMVILIITTFILSGCTQQEHTEAIGQPEGPSDIKISENTEESSRHAATKERKEPTQNSEMGLFGQQCSGHGDFKLSTFPIDTKNIELIVPMGRVQDSHVTPTDHQYIIPIGTKSGSLVTDNPGKYEIKAPADGYIINIELFKEPIEEQYRNQAYRNNYLVIFEH